MKRTVCSAAMALVLSAAVVLMFATMPASAGSMQQKDNPETGVSQPGMSTGTKGEMEGETSKHMKGEMKGESEVKPSAEHQAGMRMEDKPVSSVKDMKKFEGEAKAGAIVDPNVQMEVDVEAEAWREPAMRGDLEIESKAFFEPTTGFFGEAQAGGVTHEPELSVFYGGEAAATAERDRRFSDTSRFERRVQIPRERLVEVIIEPEIIAEPELDVFYNGEAGATAERDRRFLAKTKAGQRGEPARSIVSSDWGQVAGAGSSSRRVRAITPDYQYEISPYFYDSWFAPHSGPHLP